MAVVAGKIHANVAPAVRIVRHERKKHGRYPGPALVPFVLDVRGAWGKEAQAWLRDVTPQLHCEDKAGAVALLKWRIASTLQSAVADAALRCSTTTRRSRNAVPAPPLRAAAAGDAGAGDRPPPGL